MAVFALAEPFRPARWDGAVAELNDVAARLAERIAPTARVEVSRDGTLAGRRARLYEIRYVREGERMLDRVAFVFAGRREYQVTCRIAVATPDAGSSACDELLRSLRIR